MSREKRSPCSWPSARSTSNVQRPAFNAQHWTLKVERWTLNVYPCSLIMATFTYEPTFQLEHDETPYRLLTTEGVKEVDLAWRKFLHVSQSALKKLAQQAFTDV